MQDLKLPGSLLIRQARQWRRVDHPLTHALLKSTQHLLERRGMSKIVFDRLVKTAKNS
jgi:hypothetical protein